jgi:competence transcription factor ComK
VVSPLFSTLLFPAAKQYKNNWKKEKKYKKYKKRKYDSATARFVPAYSMPKFGRL